MRYFVPTRVRLVWQGYNVITKPYVLQKKEGDVPRGNVGLYVSSTSDEVEVDSPNFFFQTHDREFNDCVHSKLVDSDGNQQGVPARYGQLILPTSYVLGGGPWSQGFSQGRWMWGWGAIGRTFGPWAYHLSIGRLTNSTKTDIGIEFWVAFNRPETSRIAWYGQNIAGRTYRFGVEITGEIVNQVYNTRYDLRCKDIRFRFDPYGLDTTQLAEVLRAWYNTLSFTYYSGRGFLLDDCKVWENMLRACQVFVEKVIQKEVIRNLWTGLCEVWQRLVDVEPLALPDPASNFILHEKEIVAEGVDPYLVSAGQDWSQYHWNKMIQQAYLDAISSVPRLNENSISNIIEIVGFIKALVIDHRIEIPKSLSDIWLSYRYQYTTTKLDAEEAISFVHRHMSLGSLDKWISCYGVSHDNFEETEITCRCGFDIRPTDLSKVSEIWRALYTYGLSPSFYVVWDMIPYSFIVDWFIPVGKLASVLDAESQYTSDKYEIENVIFSFSYDRTLDGGLTYHQYTRFLSPGVVTLNGFYFFEEDPVSSKVIGYRALDTLALILGRR